MLWALLAFTAAITNAAYYIGTKKFLFTIDPAVLAGGGFLFTSFSLLAISGIRGIPVLGPGFITAVLATTSLNIIATVLSFRAIRDTDVSLAVPMISFTPLFNILTAAVILGELPNAPGVCGILIIVTGSYVLNTAKEHTRFSDPVRQMVTNPGVFAMLIVAFLYSVAINYDKMVMVNSDITFGSGVVFFLLGSFFCGVSLMQRYLPVAVAGLPVLFRQETVTAAPLPHLNRRLLLPFLFIAAVITIEAFCINTAYSLQIVPYIISIKRMSLIMIVLYGAAVFHEKDVARRLTGTALMVLGAVIIVIFG